MVLKIKRILYATDLSLNSAYAFRFAVDLAKNNHAEIILLHVIERLPPTHEAFVKYYIAEKDETHYETILAESIERAKKRIKVFRDRELLDYPEVVNERTRLEVIEGYPVNEILEKAKQYDCDVIVMGTHGKGFLGHTLLGSVAERVMRRANKPVVIVPLPEGKTEASIQDF